ncbi:MAG: preprotein translocase subunit SecG, partial [Acidimicrobiales bacterium]
MLTDVLVVIDAIAALGLVVLILLHSGRGGGLSDMFGASGGASAAGSTVAERNLDRITVAFVLIFT